VAPAGASVIDFETFLDLQNVTTQIAGVTISSTVVLSAGLSLNEFDFPAHSGTNVAIDDIGPIWMHFASPLAAFSGYFTYITPITLSAFNASFDLLDSATSAFSANTALSGSPGSSPNEFLEVAPGSQISWIRISGKPTGSSFTLDDATLTPSVPEPATLALLLLGGVGFARHRLARRTRR
jgi:hypothetical protein